MAKIDVHSHTWVAIEKWAKEQIEIKRDALEAPGQSDESTALKRGYIECLRDLLETTQDKPAPKAKVVSYD